MQTIWIRHQRRQRRKLRRTGDLPSRALYCQSIIRNILNARGSSRFSIPKVRKKQPVSQHDHADPNSPCRDQSEKSIKNWLHSNIKVGAIVAIRCIQDGMLRYERAVVLSIRPKNFNVSTQQRDGTFAEFGETFDYSGRNWRDPTSQVRMVVPTQGVLEACDACAFGARFMPGDARSYTYSVR